MQKPPGFDDLPIKERIGICFEAGYSFFVIREPLATRIGEVIFNPCFAWRRYFGPRSLRSCRFVNRHRVYSITLLQRERLEEIVRSCEGK